MAEQTKKSHAFALFITVLVILLALAVALFVYGSVTNGIPRPHLPDKGFFALGTGIIHG